MPGGDVFPCRTTAGRSGAHDVRHDGQGIGGPERGHPDGPRPGLTLAAVAVVQFMVSLDLSVVNVGLPEIAAGLGFGPVGLTWVIHAYALTFGGLLLLGGKAADRYGRKRVLLLGLGLFGLASFAGGFAQEPGHLVAARAAQGIGAAALAPAALALLAATFPGGRERVRAFGVWSATNAAGGALGVLIGGLLTEYAGWRWVMFVNVPMAAAALALAWRGVAAGPPAARGGRPDVLGAVLATAGMTLLVFGVVRTDQYGWTSPVTPATLAVAAALLAAFVIVERTTTRDPLIRLGLFANRSVTGANAYILLVGAAMASSFYFMSLYLQRVLGTGPGADRDRVRAVRARRRRRIGAGRPARLPVPAADPAGHRRAADRGRVRLVRHDRRRRRLPHRRPRPVDARERRLRALPGPGRLHRHHGRRRPRDRHRLRAAQQLAADRGLARARRPRHRRPAPHRPGRARPRRSTTATRSA
ncbi:MFS transporter [Actinomadura madurae]|uniref:MFS transporter n=1 Tax=Actinomadura madurae TaxID=1993 RepID=UPI0020D247C5|nr:MFS transporter [Actinomadura madurae]MCQ0015201.1 MFS transporter [Actinomadura madurae]